MNEKIKEGGGLGDPPLHKRHYVFFNYVVVLEDYRPVDDVNGNRRLTETAGITECEQIWNVLSFE